MIHIEKRTEPKELIGDKRSGVKTYDNLSTETKRVIKQQMLEEQGYLCAYCMQRISSETVTIEHFLAQNPDVTEGEVVGGTELTIDYNNMLGVCQGNEGKGKYRALTCDKHRRNKPLHVNPLKKALVQQIKYKADGTIYSYNPKINEDLNKKLNLNYDGVRFRQNRKAVLDGLKKHMDKNFSGRKTPQAILKQWRDACYVGDAGKRVPFVGIAICYLEKKIER